MRCRPLSRLLFLPTLALLAACSSGPEAVVKDFYAALDRGDAVAATGHLSARIVDMLGEEKLHAALGEFAGKMAQCGGLDRVEVSLDGEGDTRQGNSQVHFKGECSAENNAVVVVREEGDWKLGLGK